MAQVRNHPLRDARIDGSAKSVRLAPRPIPLRAVKRPPPAARFAPLTPRELECLNWCAEGKSYWETAVILGISERTVSFHMEAMRNKLKAASNAHAVATALRAELLETGAGTDWTPQDLQ